MSESTSQSSKPSVKEYYEPAPETDFEAFATVVESRRSVRRFSDEAIPDEIVERCLDLALLAPTSSNLQAWEFYRVVDPKKKAELVDACLGQPAASTAPELIVAIARTDTWKKNSADVLKALRTSPWRWPKTMMLYYERGTHILYGIGALGALGAIKKVTGTVVGAVRAVPRGPVTHSELVTWAVKTTALACENLMLAFRAAGYDTCAMEGMDEVRVKKILGLGSGSTVVMVISAGKRVPGGIYGPRIRLERDRFVHTV